MRGHHGQWQASDEPNELHLVVGAEGDFSLASTPASPQLVMSGPKMALASTMSVDSRTLIFTKPLRVELEYGEDGIVFATHRSLPASGYGRDWREALRAFERSLLMQWRMLVECDESELAPSALKRRQALERAVSKAE